MARAAIKAMIEKKLTVSPPNQNEIQQLVKEHEIGEDEGRRREDALEELTHDYSEKIDDLLKKKEEEVMAI